MKKFLVIILGVFQSILVFAQFEHDTNTIIYSWKLENNFSNPIEVKIDTLLDNFQILLPIYKISPSNAYLSNFGSPYISNVYTLREKYSDDFFFINSYLPYLLTSDNTQFYNTKSAFSTLTYSKSGNESNKEESFEAFVTENLNSKLNFGMHYNLISAKSQYKYLNVKKHSFNIFASYTGQNYMMHSSFSINRHRNDENGGIVDSSFRDSKGIGDVKDIPVNFNGAPYSSRSAYISDAVNRIRFMDLMIAQRVKLFTLSSKIDSANLKKRNIAEPLVTYVFRMSRAIKAYEHDSADRDFYDTLYYNPYRTYDSVADFRFTNTLQLEFKTTIRGKIQAGVYGLIGNQYDIYSQYIEQPDTIAGYDTSKFNEAGAALLNNEFKDKISNTYFKAGLYTNFWNRVSAHFSATIYFTGPKAKAGESILEGTFDTKVNILKHDYEFTLQSRIENKKPDFLYENYHSNHYIWEQNLSPENRFTLSSKIASPSKKFFIQGNYHVLRSLIYFNEEAKPVNADKNEIINYFSVEVGKTFKLWKFYSLNDFIYQVSGNQNVLPLPEIILYNSTYFDHTFKFKSTKGEFRAMLGVDTYYNTAYKGYSYSPALAQFYNQDNITIGDYPVMDAFLNIQLKRIRFFLKLKHFNSQWSEPNYYSAVGYPYNRMQIKFGLSVILSN